MDFDLETIVGAKVEQRQVVGGDIITVFIVGRVFPIVPIARVHEGRHVFKIENAVGFVGSDDVLEPNGVGLRFGALLVRAPIVLGVKIPNIENGGGNIGPAAANVDLLGKGAGFHTHIPSTTGLQMGGGWQIHWGACKCGGLKKKH